MENINLDKIIKPDELDFNMILSVPEEIGIKLQKIIQGNATVTEKNSTDIQIIENPSEKLDLEESRKLILRYNDHLLPITILDLPCIIEAQKTIDYKTFYKASDISQMLFVHDFPFQLNEEKDIEKFNPFESNDQYFKRLIWKKDPDHKYKLKNGISKCARNIRARRFRAKTKYNKEEILDVAKKLKSIIDNGAANFENQMKNNQESVRDDESIITNKFIDNHSEIHSQKQAAITKNSISNEKQLSINKNVINITHNNTTGTTSNKVSSINNININSNNNQNNTNFSISLNIANEKPQEKNTKSSKKTSSKKPNVGNNDNAFAVPPPSKKINKTSQANFNQSLNISLNLCEGETNENNKSSSKKSKKQSVVNDKNIILPLNEKQQISFNYNNDKEDFENNSVKEDDENHIEIDPELKKLKEEYTIYKQEYNNLKVFLDSIKSDTPEAKEKEKLKKKLKKKLKQIKEIFNSKH